MMLADAQVIDGTLIFTFTPLMVIKAAFPAPLLAPFCFPSVSEVLSDLSDEYFDI